MKFKFFTLLITGLLLITGVIFYYKAPETDLISEISSTSEPSILPVPADSEIAASTSVIAPIEIKPVRPATQLINSVPFTAQAPFGNWDDVLQDYGCEEASLLMAMHWVNSEPLTPAKARDEIVAISQFELDTYHHHHDYSLADTHKVLQAYFKYDNAFVEYDITLDDIKDEIAAGNLVIIPINGRDVTNPNYSAPGPFHHQVLVIGYDDNRAELIVHDPGTRQGASFPYNYKEIAAAIRDYPTGLNEPVETIRTGMLVIKPR